jgi:hypothetical protein
MVVSFTISTNTNITKNGPHIAKTRFSTKSFTVIGIYLRQSKKVIMAEKNKPTQYQISAKVDSVIFFPLGFCT